MATALARVEIPDDVADCYMDVRWRLSNLYKITDENGEVVTFRPNGSQQQLLDNLHYNNLILKARQLGFTTLVQLLMLDQCLFVPSMQVGMIAHRLDDAKRIFREKAMFAYHHLPDWLKAMVPLERASATEAVFANGSSFIVGTSLRSGTYRILHISEHGKLCAQFPDKAREVKTGALNTVPPGGYVFIESTAEGQSGDFYDFCQEARALAELRMALTNQHYRFHFYPWFHCARYTLSPAEAAAFEIPERYARYFGLLQAKHGITLTPGQKAWYVAKAKTQHEDMKREMPSFADEAFEAVVEGAIYADQLETTIEDERIGKKPPLPGFPVVSFWDLGIGDSDHTAIWLCQFLPNNVRRFIACYSGSNLATPHYVNWLQAKAIELKITYRGHVLPHDGANRDRGTGESVENLVKRLTGIDVRVMKAADPVLGINEIRNSFPFFEFDENECAEGLRALKAYQWIRDEARGVNKKPNHNWASHYADALRCSAFFRLSMLGTSANVRGGF